MIIAMVIILALIAIAASFFFMRQHNKQPKPNRRAYARRIRNSAVANEPEEEDALVVDPDDSDSILGLKPEPAKQEALAVETTNEPVNRAPAKEQPTYQQEQAPRPVDLITLYLIAPPQKNYRGYELLQSLLSAGLRFGAMKIFHRYQDKNGKGPVWFSLAQIANPGTFEMSKMGGFNTPGLVLFLQLNGKSDHEQAFEEMILTARELQEELGGDLLDSGRKKLTMDKVNEYRNIVRRFEEAQAVPDLFD